MANAATAYSFPQDQSNAGQVRALSPRMREIYYGEEKRQFQLQSILDGKFEAGQRLRITRGEIQTRLEMSLQAEAFAGQPFGKFVEKQMPDGSVLKEFRPSGAIDNIRAELVRVNEQIAEAADKSDLPNSNFGIVKEFVGRLPINAKLVDATLPAARLPGNGETQAAVFDAECDTLTQCEAELEAVWQLRRTKEEILERALAQMDAKAKKISLGGLARGFDEDHHGRRTVETPSNRIGIPYKSIQIPTMALFLDDAVGVMFKYFRPVFVEAFKNDLDSLPDEGRCSAKDKPPLIAAAKKKLWNQRRVTESAYRAAVDAGFNVKRPTDTPAEIILGIANKWDGINAPDQVADNAPTPKPKQPKAKKQTSLLDLTDADLAAERAKAEALIADATKFQGATDEDADEFEG